MSKQVWLALLLLVSAPGRRAPAAQVPVLPPDDGVQTLLRRVQQIVQTGNAAAYSSLLADSADRGRARDFSALELSAGYAHTVVLERDREPLGGAPKDAGYRLIVDVFSESGSRARVATWRLDVERAGRPGDPDQWVIVDQDRLSVVENLFRVSLNPTRQFTARDLTISSEDIDLTLNEGTVFVADVDLGVTAVVLLGRGAVRFHPGPQTEKGQVKIFCGSDTLNTGFNAAYLRFNPADFSEMIAASKLQATPVDPRELRRAQDVFREESAKSFDIDLGDLSRDAWSLLPAPDDFVAEIRTRRYDTLTYARSSAEAEDINFFDRKHKRNIALYASKRKLATRGRFYNEDDLVDYDVLDYDIDITSTPERQWLEGRTRMYLKVRTPGLTALTLKLADSLVVRSIVSRELGRLFGIRVKNQDTIVVNLPTPLAANTDLTLTISYAGRLEPQTPDRETLYPLQRQPEDAPTFSVEPNFLYSSRSFWYPRATVTDYATARMRISVPATLDCVASGELEPGFPALITAKDPSQNRKLYVFRASQPLRYLAFILSRFIRSETVTIGFPQPTPDPPIDAGALSGISYHSLNLSVEANPRQATRARDLAEHAADIATFYQSILGDSPYASFTIALVENDLPGGHSPAYFAELNQPLPASPFTWRNDPANFPNFGDFFLAHELAHQWWGQAVGWRSYHEQWISEGLAQFFAALYAEHQKGEETFGGVMRQMRHWAMEASDQGPVYLGYRLGHIRNDSRVFRALVYNKAAAVLQMLRRLVGDEAFFRGVRRFYRAERFHKAGTEDFRMAMEEASGRPLGRFFERWIYGSTLPKVKLSYRIDGPEVVLHAEQLTDDLFDVPLTVVLQYADRKPVEIQFPVTDRTADKRVALAGSLRGIDVSRDDGTLAEVVR